MILFRKGDVQMKRKLFLCAAAALMIGAQSAQACFTVAVGKAISPTGCVIIGHNEDDGGRVTVRHMYVPAASHDVGETLPAEKGFAAIPQVPHTYGFYWSEARTAEGGLTAADAMYNDQGVVVVSNSCARSKENTADASRLTDGGIGYNLRRIIAERASSAREGVKVAAEMIERYGYAPSGRTYTIADKNEAWLLQVVSGRHYAARRVADDETALMPNHYTIHEIRLDDPDVIASKDLISYAQSRGWYDPASGPFDFAKAYQAEQSYGRSYNILRQRTAAEMILGHPYAELTFSVKPENPVSVDMIKAILRTHYEGTPDDAPWLRAQFPGAAPHDTQVRRICTGTTIESTVWVLADRPETATVWTAFGRPCELPYIPLHPLAGIPEGLAPADGAAALKSHLQEDPAAAAWREDQWQKFRDYESLFELVYSENKESSARRLWSAEYFMAQRNEDAVNSAEKAFADGRNDEALKTLKDYDERELSRAVDEIVRWYEGLAPVSVSLQENAAQKVFEGSPLVVTFQMSDGRVPSEQTLLFGLGWSNARTRWVSAEPGSLKELGDGQWSASFSAEKLFESVGSGEERFDCWLGGRDESGRSFGGRCFFDTAQ
jgi:dipeptidase